MSDTEQKGTPPGASATDLQDLVASTDTGGRTPTGFSARLIVGVAIFWSVFQVYYASPLPFLILEGTGLNVIFNDLQARSIHLGFAVFLGFLAYPALASSPRKYIPVQDWLFSVLGAAAALYIMLFYDSLAMRPGQPTTSDLVLSVIGIVLLLEATRRVLGLPLACIATLALAYVFLGDLLIPLSDATGIGMFEVIAHQGLSLGKAMESLWTGTTAQGVFGIALGVSTSFVFLFVLFGALLDKAGAGNYFIQLAFSLLGHFRGGPAKAAVVASGATGLISGSSIANVVTTGTFTVPLMKKVGFSSEKAGAVEVASSVNGQIMPPVMGAAAFLMVEYVGIPYIEVVKHAFLPAIISYIALFYIVHLEAVKNNLKPLQSDRPIPKIWVIALAILIGFVVVSALFSAAYYLIEGIRYIFGGAAIWVLVMGLIGLYVGLLRTESRAPELSMGDPEDPDYTLPRPGPTFRAGLHYFLPICVLVWCLMVERLSPGLSAFWGVIAMILILVSQKPVIAFFRQEDRLKAAAREGWQDLLSGLEVGARNMIGIGIATATAGIIVGTVTVTGIGPKLIDLVEVLSMGSVIVMLFLVAFVSLILGMGLPTTANYIVVSTLMAPIVVELGTQNGLVVPLIAVHLFVFYFGIMADVTPPVGLASFAAAAVSGGDPIRTGLVAFWYSLRTAALPFIFIFNPEIIMIGVDSIQHATVTIVISTVAMLVFAAATQGFLLVRCRIWEVVALLLVAFTLFRPGFFWDFVYPPTVTRSGMEAIEAAEAVPDNKRLTLIIAGENIDGDMVEKTINLDMGLAVGDGKQRLEQVGLELVEEDGLLVIDMVTLNSQADKAGAEAFFEIRSVKVPADIPPRELMYLPALLLLAGIVFLQRRREDPADSGNGPVTSRDTASASA